MAADRTHCARRDFSDEGGADWTYAFASEGRPLHHGDRIAIGKIHLDVVHTPGHTPEHLTFLITDGAAADRPIKIFRELHLARQWLDAQPDLLPKS